MTRWVLGFWVLTCAEAQIFKLDGYPVPERKSLSLINAFFLADPGRTPNKTHSPPFVKFKNLMATSTSEEQTDEKLQGYLGLELHLIRYDDLWSVLDVNRMCATNEDVVQGLSDKVNHLIIGNGKNGGVNGAFGHQIRFKEKQPDAKMIMDKPGVYFLVLSNCGNFDTATVSGEVIVKNSHGYLPANEYGKMPFYAIMTACTVVVFLLWALLCVRWWKVLFNIHLIIGALALLSILESIGWFIHLFTWNESGVDNKAIFFIAIFLSVSRSTLSYMLVLSACLGWGVTKPVLDGGTICRMVSLSLVYIALNVVREVVLADRHQQTVPVAFVILCLLPVSLMNGGIFYWIFAALSNLMETLEAQGQTAKLSLFQQLWWVLVSGIVFAFAVLLAQIFIVANDTSSWQYQWLVQDCAPQTGFLIVLIAVMYLWCPNEDTQRFAYSAQLEGELDNLDEHIEKAEVLSADEKEVDVIGARS
ncbi:Transmembrane protein 87A [Durusdinium trenchii]|uniref:Transmembrane protein 87A n=1 Tax=Durusdinium trenchii TaxID=1381693 RepID=A0ABP0RAB2_9DINO